MRLLEQLSTSLLTTNISVNRPPEWSKLLGVHGRKQQARELFQQVYVKFPPLKQYLKNHIPNFEQFPISDCRIRYVSEGSEYLVYELSKYPDKVLKIFKPSLTADAKVAQTLFHNSIQLDHDNRQRFSDNNDAFLQEYPFIFSLPIRGGKTRQVFGLWQTKCSGYKDIFNYKFDELISLTSDDRVLGNSLSKFIESNIFYWNQGIGSFDILGKDNVGIRSTNEGNKFVILDARGWLTHDQIRLKPEQRQQQFYHRLTWLSELNSQLNQQTQFVDWLYTTHILQH